MDSVAKSRGPRGPSYMNLNYSTKGRERGGSARLGYLSRGPEFIVTGFCVQNFFII